MHGHTYKLEVAVSGAVGNSCMVMDFGDLKRIVQARVIDILDHRTLNHFQGLSVPTAEKMCFCIWKWLEKEVSDTGASLYRVRVWETPTSYAELHCSEVMCIARFGE